MFASRNTSIDLDGTKNSPARPRQPVPAAEPGLERHVDAHAPDSSRPAENPVLPAPASEMHSATTRAREILFVDPGVSDIATLLSHLRPEVEAILLDPARPAARQMSMALAEERGLDAIHVIAHGTPAVGRPRQWRGTPTILPRLAAHWLWTGASGSGAVGPPPVLPVQPLSLTWRRRAAPALPPPLALSAPPPEAAGGS